MLKKGVREYLNTLEVSSAVIESHTVAARIREIIKKDDERSLEDEAEIFAFNVYAEEENNSSWDSYFGPMMSFADKLGNPVDFPALSTVTSDALDYWETRFNETEHPILKALYGDLLIEFSALEQRRIEIQTVKETISSHINSSSLKSGKHFSAKQDLHRAFSLTNKFKQSDKLSEIFTQAIKLEDEIAEDDKPGLWGFVLDWFLINKDFYAPKAIEEEYIKSFTERHQRLIDAESIWPLENSSLGLCAYYKKNKELVSVERVLKEYEDCVRNFSEFTESSMGALHYLQNIESVYLQFNVSESTEKSLTQIQYELKNFRLDKDDPSFKTISATTTISNKQLEEFTSNVFGSGELSKIAVSMTSNFIIRKEHEREQLKLNSQKYVFSSLVSQSIFDDEDKLLAVLPPYENGSENHLIKHCADSLAINSLFLEIVCKELRERFDSEGLVDYMNETGLYNGADLLILRKILDSFWQKDSLSCVHIGIPFIESTIRKLLATAGIAVTKKNGYEGYDYIPLGALLNNKLTVVVFKHVFKDAGEDLLFTLKVLLTEKLGLNLRNKVAHGIYQSDFIKDKYSNNIVLILMILSITRIKD
jgi:hypothetical protein